MTARENLSSVVEEIKRSSYSEKQEIKTEEEIMNSFLDAINDLKKILVDKTKRIEDIAERIESLSWYTNPDQESLEQLNELIVLAKDVHSSLIRQYVSFNSFRQQGIAKQEIVAFKQAIDFFAEAYTDIESAFFIFPKDKEFVEITQRLSEGE